MSNLTSSALNGLRNVQAKSCRHLCGALHTAPACSNINWGWGAAWLAEAGHGQTLGAAWLAEAWPRANCASNQAQSVVLQAPLVFAVIDCADGDLEVRKLLMHHGQLHLQGSYLCL